MSAVYETCVLLLPRAGKYGCTYLPARKLVTENRDSDRISQGRKGLVEGLVLAEATGHCCFHQHCVTLDLVDCLVVRLIPYFGSSVDVEQVCVAKPYAPLAEHTQS